jgi:PKD repeat protein
MTTSGWRCICALLALLCCGALPLEAATRYVSAGGDLQEALNTAQPGDTILLEEGAEFVGNFVLPVKSGDQWITVRTSAPAGVLPPAGVRIKPSHAPVLARLRSPNSTAALRTAAGAHHWDVRYLEFGPNENGNGDIIQIGDGSSAQNTLDKVPHHIVLNHLYIHGDPAFGQKRGVALNGANVTISDSYVSECKGVGQDTQAIGGWNGPGPYTIENNYLEAAGENVMFGGADPAIPNLVADGISFRRNYVSRPMAWREPFIGTPQGLSANEEAGGSLVAGTYAYRVVARSVARGSFGLLDAPIRSTASVEISANVTTPAGAVHLRWQPVAGAAEYRVYGRTAGAEAIYWTVTTAEFVDIGAAGTTEAVPTTTGTVWNVKNLFELKNARNVLIEDNIFENHWKEGQPGYAILMTPRNSNGACTWCVVENVRFQHNLLSNATAGFNILGYDSARPTRQTNNIVITDNVVRLTTTLGGNGWFMLIGDGPRDVTIERNTIDSNGSTVVYTYGGTVTSPRKIYGMRFVANAARHGTYGMGGALFSYGSGILNGFYPDLVFEYNYLAGGPCSSRYWPYWPTTICTGRFEDQFVDFAGGDYTLVSGSILKGAGPGGTDIGVDYPALAEALEGVREGSPGGAIPPSADFTSSCTSLNCTFVDASVPGGSPIAGAAWDFGDGTQGTGAQAAHSFSAAGAYTVTLTVTDTSGLSSSSSKIVTVTTPNSAPNAGFTPVCVDLTCTFTDTSSDPDGTVVSWAWTFGTSGTAAIQTPSFGFAAAGTYDVTLTVTDNDGAVSTVSKAVQVTALLHAAYSGTTTKWINSSGTPTANPYYWSATVTVGLHGADERPIAGATVVALWSGAVSKTVSCITSASGACTFKSGTLSWLRSSVTLTVTSVSAPLSVYAPGANHNEAGALTGPGMTLIQP